MAKIDTSKLLPASKSSAIVPYRKPTIVGSTKTAKISSAIQPISLASKSSAIVKKKNDETIQEVVVKLIGIQGVLTDDLRISQRRRRSTDIKEEQEENRKEEEKLEEPKAKGFKFPKLPELPTIGFFERIKRFLFFTALGWLLPKILEFLPKLEGIVKTIGTVYGFVEDIFGKLFDGFTSLVKFGGDLTKKTLGFIAQTGLKPGEKFDDKFNALETTFNRFVDASIIAGLLSADLGLAAFDEYKKWKGKNKPKPKPDGNRRGGKPPIPRGKVPVTEGRGGQPSTGGRPKGKVPITGDVVKPQSWWNKIASKFKLPSWMEKTLSKLNAGPFAKLKGPFRTFLGKVVPFAGAAISEFDAQQRFARGDVVGGTIARTSGALDAFAGGVGLTSVGFLSTIIGAPVAAILGKVAAVATGISMTLDVLLLIRDTLQAFGVQTFSQGGRVVRRYQGGGTTPTRGGQPVSAAPRRSLKIEKKRKPFKLPPVPTKPGKDVGGEDKIKILYPHPKKPMTVQQWMTKDMAGDYKMYLDSFNQSKENKKPDAFTALTSVAKSVKPLDVVGQLMGAGVDLALGQATDKKIFNSFFDNIGYLADTWMNQKMNQNLSLISREISSFADGGKVPPSREMKNLNNGESFGDVLTKLLGPMINQRINESLHYIKKEIQKKPDKEKEGEAGDGAGGDLGGIAGGDYGGFSPPAGIQKEIYDYLTKVKKLSDIQALGLLANINRESSFRPGVQIIDINGKPSGGLFQWNAGRFEAMVKRVPDWKTNWKGQVDWALNEPWIQGRNGKAYIAKTFSSAQEAADWWMTEWEVVRYPERDSKKHREYLRSIPRAPDGTARFRAPEITQSRGPRPGVSVSGGIKDTGLKDYLGRPIKFKGLIADAFIDMAADARKNGIDIGRGINNSLRSSEENRLAGGARGSRHLTGEAFDINWNTPAGEWIRRNAPRFGFRYNQYSHNSTHFDWDGGYSPRNSSQQSRPQTTSRGQQRATQVQPRITPPPTRSLIQLQEQVKNMRPGGPPVTVPGVGRVTYTQNDKGTWIKTFYIENSKVEPSKFFEAYRRRGTQTPPSTRPQGTQPPSSRPRGEQASSSIVPIPGTTYTYRGSTIFRAQNGKYYSLERGNVLEVFKASWDFVRSKGKKTTDAKIPGKQQGGLISPSKPTRTIPNSFASYENYGQGTIVAMQPIIIERTVPVNSSGSGVIAFPVPVSVNNNTDNILKFSRG